MRDITELPLDIFLLILSHLSPATCIRCRAVSRQWRHTFTSDDISLLLLRWNFPRCRELRLAKAAALLSASPRRLPWLAIRSSAAAELAALAEKPPPWSATFAVVACRYHHLHQARPRLVQKIRMSGHDRNKPSLLSFRGVATWNRFLRLDDKTANFHYPDPAWSYSQEDGVLVYPADVTSGGADETEDGNIYQVLDLASGTRATVPFDVRQKHVRRVRLAQGVLVFEWAEALPYHQLNDREVVHRHFVTAFDVVHAPTVQPEKLPASSASSTLENSPEWSWQVTFRSEWKLHFLGLPLNRSGQYIQVPHMLCGCAYLHLRPFLLRPHRDSLCCLLLAAQPVALPRRPYRATGRMGHILSQLLSSV